MFLDYYLPVASYVSSSVCLSATQRFISDMDLVGVGRKFVFRGKLDATTSLKIGAHDDSGSGNQYVFKVFSSGAGAGGYCRPHGSKE